MSLYDDLDVKSRTNENVQGWSSGIKLLQSQLQLKKATVTHPARTGNRKISLAPVIDLKSKRDDDDMYMGIPATITRPDPPLWPSASSASTSTSYNTEFDWNVKDEYDPLWPNEYEKVIKDLKDKSREKRQDRDKDRDRETRELEKEEKRKEKKRKSRFNDPSEQQQLIQFAGTEQIVQPPVASGFAGRWEEDIDLEPVQKSTRPSGGAAIAPPPSLQEIPEPVPVFPNKPQPSSSSSNYGASSVAAKIMAKYGFKEGQGLGKSEQGMSSALQVEKTSKRGGRIVHEKEFIMPPPLFAPPAASEPDPEPEDSMAEPAITEIIKNPSKVVLLKNMVGPGEVDDDLEPEVKDECNTKYGPVASVIIHEVPNVIPEETVRIFVEFLRIESAIKAVVDLNGRFFGGREVKAGFYDTDKFDNLQLMD